MTLIAPIEKPTPLIDLHPVMITLIKAGGVLAKPQSAGMPGILVAGKAGI